MTQQEYNDYIAHGGKWGYTNGVPNGKKKAQGLLDQVNTLRKKAGKTIVKTGNQVVKGGKKVAYDVASVGNRQLMNGKNKKITSDLSSTSSAGSIQKRKEKAAIAAAKRQDALRQQSSKSKKLEKTRKAQKELDKLHKSMYDRTKLYGGPKSLNLDDHKKENRTQKKHGQPSTTRGVRKQ